MMVSPQDSVTLTYLLNIQQESGDGAPQSRLLMTLRNPNDQSRQPTESATLQFLLSQYNIPVPAKLPYALEPALAGLLKTQETISTP